MFTVAVFGLIYVAFGGIKKPEAQILVSWLFIKDMYYE
jgi:hypothetical protein